MEGHGTFSWPGGDRYEGQFLNGKMHGDGVYHYADGFKYQGSFKDG